VRRGLRQRLKKTAIGTGWLYFVLMSNALPVSEHYLMLCDVQSSCKRSVDPKRKSNADRRISVRVTAAQFAALELRAAELRLSVADFVRQSVGL
jgi:hypothetical protein